MMRPSTRYQLIIVAALGLAIASLMVTATRAQPPIPHSVEGISECLACHQAGLGDASRLPSDHREHTDADCTVCHVPSGVVAPPPSAAVHIPHPLEGRGNCLMCHETGVAGAPEFPPDHAGRTNEACQACHQPAEATPMPALPIPAEVVCSDCHQFLPARHAEIIAQPVGDADRGATLFAENCARCHGQSGERETAGVVINSREYLEAHDEAMIFGKIAAGVPGMMPYARANGGPLTDSQIWDLVAFIKGW